MLLRAHKAAATYVQIACVTGFTRERTRQTVCAYLSLGSTTCGLIFSFKFLVSRLILLYGQPVLMNFVPWPRSISVTHKVSAHTHAHTHTHTCTHQQTHETYLLSRAEALSIAARCTPNHDLHFYCAHRISLARTNEYMAQLSQVYLTCFGLLLMRQHDMMSEDLLHSSHAYI